MRYNIEVIKPTYIHYSNKWDIVFCDISFRKHIIISPREVRYEYAIALLGFGIKGYFARAYAGS
jgi:hypothetical protein